MVQSNTTLTQGLPKRILFLIYGSVITLVLIICCFSMWENNSADTIMIIQYPNGNLNICKDAGIKLQMFGKVTRWNKRSQFWFSKASDQGSKDDQSIKIRFNDGAHAQISGSFAYYLPLSDSLITQLYTTYGTQEAIELQLIRTIAEKAVYFAGPLMSSKESYSETRNDLIGYIDDQIIHGVYKTFTEQKLDKDPMTGAPRTIGVVKIVRDKNDNIIRQDISPLERFGIKIDNLSLNSVDYDKQVEDQIQAQQQAIQQVQLAIAKAKEAEQAAITAAKNGEAEAAKSKWAQEVIKAQVVTEAQQKLEVAKLDVATAEQYKQKKIKEAEGDAEYKRKIIVADGALTQKLEAWVEVNKAYAAELGKQRWVPDIVMGGNSDGKNISSAQQLIDLFSVKTARDLNLDLSVPKGGNGK